MTTQAPFDYSPLGNGPIETCGFALGSDHSLPLVGAFILITHASFFKLDALHTESMVGNGNGTCHLSRFRMCLELLIWLVNAGHAAMFFMAFGAQRSIAGTFPILAFIGVVGLTTWTLFGRGPKRPRRSMNSLCLLAQLAIELVLLKTLRSWNCSFTIVACARISIALQISLLSLDVTSKRMPPKTPTQDSSEELVGAPDKSVMSWVSQVIWKGDSAALAQSDLLPLDSKLKSGRLRDRIVLDWDEHKSGQSPLLRSLMPSMLRPFLWTVPPRLAWIVVRYAQTFLISAAVSFLEKPIEKRESKHAYNLVGATVVIYIGTALVQTTLQETRNRMTVIFRGLVVSLIYDKALQHPSVYDDLPAVTLVSADIEQIRNALMYASEVCFVVLELGIGIGLLWRQLGPVALAPLLVTAITGSINTKLARIQGARRKPLFEATQKRVGLASAILGAMKSIKLGGLSQAMAYRLQNERRREMGKANSVRWLTVWQNTVAETPSALSGLLVFSIYTIQANFGFGEPLTTAKAFTSLALVSMMTTPASMLLQATSAVFSASGNIVRLEEYLKKPELEDPRVVANSSSTKLRVEKANEILVLEHVILDVPSKVQRVEIDHRIVNHSITMISGPVGSGKSTLCRVILGESAPVSGKVTIRAGSIAYCSATPWLRNTTIKDNVLCDKDWDEQWYQEIITVCDLGTDLSSLPLGDSTPVGSRGVNLSGGQKHRVALARALYSRSPFLLLDETFGALDRRTKDTVAERVVKHARQQGLTLIFVSHDDHLAQYADEVLELHNEGSSVSSPDNWLPNRTKDIQSALDASETIDSAATAAPATRNSSKEPSKSKADVRILKGPGGDHSVWLYYARSIGVFHCVMLLLAVIIAAMTSSFPHLWLKAAGKPGIGLRTFVGIYALAAVLENTGVAAVLWETMIYIASCSSIRLHQVLVATTFNAPMSYFDSTDSSVMLNLFSNDMMQIQSSLPIMASFLLQGILACTVHLAFLVIGSSYMAMTIFPAVYVLYRIHKMHLPASRRIENLNQEAKSPVFQQFTETGEGISTIRAFQMQGWHQKDFLARLDESQRPYYLMLCTQRWLSLACSVVVGILAVLLMSFATATDSSSAGSMGAALTTMLTASVEIQNLISSWSSAESSLTSVARVKDFEETTPNENLQSDSPTIATNPGESWPNGRIEVKRLKVVYGEGDGTHTAVENVSFVAEPGKTLGVCGRTGSGKSTIVSVLLRLVDPDSGSVLIDGVDITTIPRDVVRRRLICLPQDPFLVAGTFASAIDAGNTATAAEMQSALELVQLWDLVAARGGLEAEFRDDSLSNGERQLLAIAAAILRNRQCEGRSILILDEASSNLDPATTSMVHRVIRNEFRNQTIVSVNHKAEALEFCDAVVTLDRGRVSEGRF